MKVEMEVEMEVPKVVNKGFRCPKDLADWIDEKARKEHRTFSSMIVYILEQIKQREEARASVKRQRRSEVQDA